MYAGMFSADKCWYRCKLQSVLNDDQCLAVYIDYGNSEVLNRSSIVDLPNDLQFPAIAQKYRLWGLQLQDYNDLDQGQKFLNNLIGDKKISVKKKVNYKDGTIVVEAWHENIDVGEEITKKGFAERCKIINGTEAKTELSACSSKTPQVWMNQKRERPPMREPKTFPVNNYKGSEPWMENNCENSFLTARIKPLDACVGNAVKQDEKFLEEIKQLKEEKEALMLKSSTLESQLQELQHKFKKEKEVYEGALSDLEKDLQSAVGNKMRSLTTKIEILRSARHENDNLDIGNDLLEAVRVVTKEKLIAPSSLCNLDKSWTEYKVAQEMIQHCSDTEKLNTLITSRNSVQQSLLSSVDRFIMEVDELPLETRTEQLQTLLSSLELVYGVPGESMGTGDAFDEFHRWKQMKLEQFASVRDDSNNSLEMLLLWFCHVKEFFDLSSESTYKSSEVVGNIDETLDQVESYTSKELDVSLVEPHEADRQIIKNAYNRVVKCIHEELNLVSILKSKYSSSAEFRNSIEKWISRSPNVDKLMSIKKNIKRLKAQLRWKLVERSSLEDSDESEETNLAKLKEETGTLRDEIFFEILREQEEYSKLSILVQKWFPELPLIHPEAGILGYMNSGGLLSSTIERDLFDAQPMKELSSKRPLVRAEVQNKMVLLKGYSVGKDTEEKVVKRAAKYHEAWSNLKEDSGVMELIYLFFCKSDPLVYLMVPFYFEESLAIVQAMKALANHEIMKVMSGVAQGLQTLHSAGIIVGSLHENNIFAINREKGIIGDFDFTKDVCQRSSITTVGSPHLTAPEIKLGHTPSEASDIFVQEMAKYP
ncbi:hypothetical protein GDO86_011720 [Hymenochirus boettgeri]|uniref:Serine/threonine kinase 31 n=1 Tax=Hymenochirus boettgeri TaxID=247094 RepID=A0A8T2JHI1_9PIPI|nr:hypothetical protein GDO86_011720 [Hymenochirus boettgeri]